MMFLVVADQDCAWRLDVMAVSVRSALQINVQPPAGFAVTVGLVTLAGATVEHQLTRRKTDAHAFSCGILPFKRIGVF